MTVEKKADALTSQAEDEGKDALDGQEPEGVESESPDTSTELDRLRASVTKANREAAKFRKERQELFVKYDKLQKQVAKSLGMEDDEVTPDELSKQLTQARADLRGEKISNALARVAGQLNADYELTLAYMQHKNLFDDLEPGEEEFESMLTERVKGVLKANPKLKNAPAPGASGSEFGKGTDSKKPDMNAWLRSAAGLQ